LRAILAGVHAASWPISSELDLLRTLFDLYRLRDADLYCLELQLPEPLPAVELPPLLLLPLAENAIKHGPAAGHRGPVSVTVSVDEEAGRLLIAISNPGPWQGQRPGGEGLHMVARRIDLAYAHQGGEASLMVGGAGARTVAELSLPLAGPRPEAPA
jgi:two-component system, LytTR family, sensor histidine kinase AlgZ